MWFTLCMAIWLLVISIQDIRSRKVSGKMLVMGAVLTLVTAVSQSSDYLDILLGTLPGAFLLIMAFTVGNVGYGDGIVLLFLGMVSGSGKSFLIFGVSLFLAAICSLVLLVLRKAERKSGIPFLPFLTMAWLIAIVI